MEQSELQLLLQHIETEQNKLTDSMSELKRMINRLNEENNRLRIQNDTLLSLVTDSTKEEHPTTTTPAQSSEVKAKNGRERLQSFYNDNIHVCHPYFGSRRQEGEECMFCQAVLDSLEVE
ncbi:initiation control protein YabA [Fundicoccus culcitae]|uniref:DNA replication initiation control protein YabA n=1 Tax=Fundicoccus culcitae TaxID=2969821 RepID=A0ABY5P3F9_9LACT|nr:initiation control protein YabA [Fundicoccus culcitae]UUX33145.1 DNA replication initiation control protein YabA [Fundicoccus culcitae]